jgi:DNA-binding NarL/FixJ family response regulator
LAPLMSQRSIVRILVVEDDPRVRQGLLGAVPWGSAGMSVVGSCESVGEALALVERGLEFEVGLIDLGLPDRPGTELMSALSRLQPEACLLALTSFDDAESIFGALKAGARGYLLKDTPPEQLVRAVREAAEGGAPMTPAVARKVVESFSRPPPSAECADLTPREREVLELLTRGLVYAGVAEQLGMGLGTVQTYVKSLYRKLQVRSKAEATAVALRRGLVSPR